jgi:imidazolonepropionase-like amidohydrolase
MMGGAFDLLLRGGMAVLAGWAEPIACDIAIANGRIAAVLAPGTAVTAEDEIPLRGAVVMPGAIAVHLHLGYGKDISRPRMPRDAEVESAAAACGASPASSPT